MSIELLVMLGTADAPTAAAWNRALKDDQAPVQFAMPERLDLTRDSGFIPIIFRGRETDFYFARDATAKIAVSYPPLRGYVQNKPIVYSLSYEQPGECAAAVYAASELVTHFQGTAFDSESAAILSTAQLADAGRLCGAASQGEVRYIPARAENL